MSLIEGFDNGVLNFINTYLHDPMLDKVMPWITFLGDNSLIWILICLSLVINKKYRLVGLMTGFAVLLAVLLGDGLLKHLIQRTRPFEAEPIFQLLISRPISFSFPSGHTATSFAAAGVLSHCLKGYRAYVYILASFIAFSRMYLYVHYPSDIIGGIVLGIICSMLTLYFFRSKMIRMKL